MAADGGGGSRNGDDDDEVNGPFSDAEFARRPEVRFINQYALGRAYVRIGLKGIGALALLWASVVLLGGFVTVLKQLDFWLLTFIAFVQAAGLSDAMGDDRFAFFGKWIGSLNNSITSWGEKFQRKDNWFKRQIKIIVLKLIHSLMYVIFYPVAYFAIGGPIICIGLSVSRLTQQDYGSASGDASKANLKPALNLFYYVSLIHSVIFLLVTLVESLADIYLVDFVSPKHGFSLEVLDSYFHETKRMCVNNPVSAGSWNLITYGAALLDSELPEDYASGVRVVTMLIEQGIPIRRLLIRSSGRRIRKLIGALVWRSPVEGETRWLATKIVEHIAPDLSLAQFPGAPECVSSLLDTSYHNNVEQEAHHLPTRRSKARRKSLLSEILQPQGKEGAKTANLLHMIMFLIQRLWFAMTGGRKDNNKLEEHVDSKATEGTNEDLILQGLRILKNLAQDQHNCTVICNTKGLVSKITTPVSSNRLTEDIKINASWIKVVDTSLKVVSHLVRAPGDTGRGIRHQIAYSINTVENLKAILHLQSNNGSIVKLQMRSIEVLAQLFFHDSTRWAGKGMENFIERVLHIFLTVEWVGYFLVDEKRTKIKNDEIKEAMKTASRLKEKAGEALAMLSMGSQSNSETILHAYSQTPISIQRLTEMLDSKTIECKINETENVEAEIKIGCRISAAVILKNLCPYFTTMDGDYVRNTTLRKVLEELLHITTDSRVQENTTSTLQCWEHCCITLALHCIVVIRNGKENPRDGEQDKHSAAQRHMQQSEERRLQAALLTLCTDVCAKYSIKAPDLARMVAQKVSLEGFVRKIDKLVEENSHATPACLAILKLTSQMVKELILDDETSEALETRKITDMLSSVVSRLSEASKTMSGVETCMLFGGTDNDYYGVPAKPLLSVLVRMAEQRLQERKDGWRMNTPAAGGGP